MRIKNFGPGAIVAAAFIGPALIGLFLVIFKDTSLMLLPLLVLFVIGIIVLYLVKTDEII